MASHRSIARIPLHVFADLIVHQDDDPYSPSVLRDAICRKLLEAGRSMYLATDQGIATVGQLLRLAPTALLRALDPLLTIGKNVEWQMSCFFRRVDRSIRSSSSSS